MLTVSMVSAQTFTLKSNEIGGQATTKQEFNGFGCSGDNVSPQLSWENAPEGTKSFAITMHDPDAPTESGFWHWIVFDIPANAMEIPSGAGTKKGMNLPNLSAEWSEGAIQSMTSYGTPGYGGPCPPQGHGIHEYKITVHALKTEKLGLDANATPAVVAYYLWLNTIEKASIVMYYEREK